MEKKEFQKASSLEPSMLIGNGRKKKYRKTRGTKKTTSPFGSLFSRLNAAKGHNPALPSTVNKGISESSSTSCNSLQSVNSVESSNSFSYLSGVKKRVRKCRRSKEDEEKHPKKAGLMEGTLSKIGAKIGLKTKYNLQSCESLNKEEQVESAEKKKTKGKNRKKDKTREQPCSSASMQTDFSSLPKKKYPLQVISDGDNQDSSCSSRREKRESKNKEFYNNAHIQLRYLCQLPEPEENSYLMKRRENTENANISGSNSLRLFANHKGRKKFELPAASSENSSEIAVTTGTLKKKAHIVGKKKAPLPPNPFQEIDTISQTPDILVPSLIAVESVNPLQPRSVVTSPSGSKHIASRSPKNEEVCPTHQKGFVLEDTPVRTEASSIKNDKNAIKRNFDSERYENFLNDKQETANGNTTTKLVNLSHKDKSDGKEVNMGSTVQQTADSDNPTSKYENIKVGIRPTLANKELRKVKGFGFTPLQMLSEGYSGKLFGTGEYRSTSKESPKFERKEEAVPVTKTSTPWYKRSARSNPRPTSSVYLQTNYTKFTDVDREAARIVQENRRKSAEIAKLTSNPAISPTILESLNQRKLSMERRMEMICRSASNSPRINARSFNEKMEKQNAAKGSAIAAVNSASASDAKKEVSSFSPHTTKGPQYIPKSSSEPLSVVPSPVVSAASTSAVTISSTSTISATAGNPKSSSVASTSMQVLSQNKRASKYNEPQSTKIELKEIGKALNSEQSVQKDATDSNTRNKYMPIPTKFSNLHEDPNMPKKTAVVPPQTNSQKTDEPTFRTEVQSSNPPSSKRESNEILPAQMPSKFKWSCPRCTLENPSWRLLCDACYYRRDTVANINDELDQIFSRVDTVRAALLLSPEAPSTSQDRSSQAKTTASLDGAVQSNVPNSLAKTERLPDPPNVKEDDQKQNLLSNIPVKENIEEKFMEIGGNVEKKTLECNESLVNVEKVREARLSYFSNQNEPSTETPCSSKSVSKDFSENTTKTKVFKDNEDDTFDHLFFDEHLPTKNSHVVTIPTDDVTRLQNIFDKLSLSNDLNNILRNVNSDSRIEKTKNNEHFQNSQVAWTNTFMNVKLTIERKVGNYFNSDTDKPGQSSTMLSSGPGRSGSASSTAFSGEDNLSPRQLGNDSIKMSRLLRDLEIAINNHNHQKAAKLAHELALLRICSQEASLSNHSFRIKVYVEDRFMQQGPFYIQISSGMKIKELKRKIESDWNIPFSFQRWILGRKVAEDDEAFVFQFDMSADSMAFLYLVTPQIGSRKNSKDEEDDDEDDNTNVETNSDLSQPVNKPLNITASVLGSVSSEDSAKNASRKNTEEKKSSRRFSNESIGTKVTQQKQVERSHPDPQPSEQEELSQHKEQPSKQEKKNDFPVPVPRQKSSSNRKSLKITSQKSKERHSGLDAVLEQKGNCDRKESNLDLKKKSKVTSHEQKLKADKRSEELPLSADHSVHIETSNISGCNLADKSIIAVVDANDSISKDSSCETHSKKSNFETKILKKDGKSSVVEDAPNEAKNEAEDIQIHKVKLEHNLSPDNEKVFNAMPDKIQRTMSGMTDSKNQQEAEIIREDKRKIVTNIKNTEKKVSNVPKIDGSKIQASSPGNEKKCATESNLATKMTSVASEIDASDASTAEKHRLQKESAHSSPTQLLELVRTNGSIDSANEAPIKSPRSKPRNRNIAYPGVDGSSNLNQINTNCKIIEVYQSAEKEKNHERPESLNITQYPQDISIQIKKSHPQESAECSKNENAFKSSHSLAPSEANATSATSINTSDVSSSERDELAKQQTPGELEDRKTSLQELMTLMETSELIPNAESFECPVCFLMVEPKDGVVLRDCLHVFCKECLVGVIEHAEESVIKCPYMDKEYSCESSLQEREIKALVSTELFEKYLARSVKLAECKIAKSFHCKTSDCTGWCVFEDDVNTFNCPICRKRNCLTCAAIHEGVDCLTYQRQLAIDAETDQNAKSSRLMLEKMISRGEALECPACHVVLLKKWGCDWVKCSYCKTEICWVTKNFRWGPNGKGDISGGCKCGVKGIKCHPRCTYCH